MKKIFLLIATVFLFLTSHAATGLVIGADPDSLTNSSTTIRMIVTGSSGPYRIVTSYGSGADTSIYLSGTGTKVSRVVGLMDATSYNATISLLSGTGANDTIGTTLFTTLATPVTPTLSGAFIAPDKIRITGTDNHPMFMFLIYGIGFMYDTYTDTFYVKPGAVDDTFTLSVLPATSYNYLMLTYGAPYVTGAAAVLGNRGGGSFTTPATPPVTEGDISGGLVSWGIDTAQLRYTFTPGSLPTGMVNTYLFDSLGSTPLRTISSGITPVSGTNYVSVSLLTPNTYYRILAIYSHGSYRDSVWVTGRTSQVPPPTWNGGETARVITTSSIAFTQLINSGGAWSCSDVQYAWRYRISSSSTWVYGDTFSGTTANVLLTGLSTETIYVIDLWAWNCGGLITRTFSEETNPGLAAPVLNFTGGIEANCGSLKVMNLSIDVATGDTADVFVLYSLTSSSFSDTLRWFRSLRSDLSTGTMEITGLPANQNVWFRAGARNHDGAVSYSSVISSTTIPGSSATINRNLVGVTETTATFNIFGSAECDLATVEINVYDEENVFIANSTFGVGSNTYSFPGRIITGLDLATNYRATFTVHNSYGPVGVSDILFRTAGSTATGIEELLILDWTAETQVTVSNPLGQTLGHGAYKDILKDFSGEGLIFVTDTFGKTKKLVIQ